jgi:Protein of unknown function, DUF547
MKKISILFSLILSVSLLWAVTDPGDYFSQSNSGNKEKVDHQKFQDILNKYLDNQDLSGINKFDYKSVSQADKNILKNYLKYLSNIEIIKLNKFEQLAYWINMYNALTIDVILDNYPVKTIKDIKSGIFTPGPWKLKLISVEKIELSLNDIEHKILRPIWKDKRIHYAVNCASIACPNLSKAVYSSEDINSMLNSAAEEYINHSRGLSFSNNKLILSSIYNWYKEDFGTKKELLEHLADFAEEDLKQKILSWTGSLKYEYNWDLNSL